MNVLSSLVSKQGDPSGSPAPNPKASPPSKFRFPAAFLPVGILLGFLLIFAWIFGDRLIPAPGVEVVSVITLPAAADFESTAPPAESISPTSASLYEGDPLFQASGWIEADPYPIRAVALTSGVVEEVYVLEGEPVEQGQLLATLIDEDAQLRLDTARAYWNRKKAELAMAQSHTESAAAAMEVSQARIAAARANLEVTSDEMTRLREAGNQAIPEGRIRQAIFAVQAREAEVAEAEAARAESRSRWQTSLLAVEVVQEEERAAQVALDEAQLALDRTRITSPISGVVQRLLASPGQKKMLSMDNPESATIAVLFKPEQLQARIDVPLEQAAQMSMHQPVWIRTPFLPEARFKGRVTRVVGEADLQRNTLQAKVAILDPDPRLRPEMLCRAEFLPPIPRGGETASSPSYPTSQLRLYIPTRTLASTEDRSARVWVVGLQDSRLESRTLQLASPPTEEVVQVLDGLRPGERVVVDPSPTLKPGKKMRPRLIEITP